MHILIIPSWYKNNENPVKGSFFEEQARALIKLGHKVTVFFIDFRSFTDRSQLENRIEDDQGLQTFYYSYKAKFPRNRNLNYYLLSYFALKKYRSYERANGTPDIIHAHSVFYGGIIANYLSKHLKKPFVITEHLTRFITGDVKNRIDLKIAKEVFNNANSCIVVSQSFKNDLSEKLQIRSDIFNVVNNMVSPEFFNDFKLKKLHQNEPLRFFTNSFISFRKNHKLIIEAFKIVCNKFPNAELILGGASFSEEDKLCEREIRKLAENLEIKDKVLFLGALSRAQVKEEMIKCHAFLLGSSYETFGVVLIEALACGRPVITTNSKGPQDIVNDKNGIIVGSFKPEDYAKVMIQLVENYERFDQAEIRNDCMKRFSDQVIMNKIEAIYEKVISKNIQS